METKPLASFAVNTRLKLIQSSQSRIEQALIEDSQERLEKPLAVAKLEEEIKAKGIEQVVSDVSYLWFNRFLALTMLDAIGFNSPLVLSPSPGAVYPEILQEAKAGRLNGLALSPEITARVQGILSGQIPSANSDAEIYALLVQAVCKSWADRFPMIFQASSEVAEMLAPSDLLSLDSTRADFVREIRGGYSTDIETIGWLFQFYNSDVKDSAFAKFKTGKKATHQDLVAATQIFTPRAIAKSMVENTLGSIWGRMHPNSALAMALPEVAKLDSECPEIVPPEQLTVLDPAVGSGNLLLSAYDYLEKIYLESGYNTESIPGLILENNLHGIDIDPRAASMASFALWLRAARSLDKARAMSLPQPKIVFLENSPILLDIAEGCEDLEVRKRLSIASNAGTLGTLVRMKDPDLDYLSRASGENGLISGALHSILESAKLLAGKYSVVLANPPYMGPKNMPQILRSALEEGYSEGKADLYGAFLIRSNEFITENGRIGLITQAAWLNLKRFESLRRWFCRNARDAALIRANQNVFFGIGSFVDKALTFSSKSGSALTREIGFSSSTNVMTIVDLSKFEVIFGMPFAFGVPEHLLGAFSTAPSVGSIVKSNNGTKTGENETFLRFWWEVEPTTIQSGAENSAEARSLPGKWFPYTKGGSPRKWFGNMVHVINWEDDGRELRKGVKKNGSERFFQTMSSDLAFQPYLCWSDISTSPAFRYTPKGFMTDLQSPAIAAPNMYGLLAFLNSDVVSVLINILNPTIHIKIRDVETIPLLLELDNLTAFGESAVKTAEKLWNLQETSMSFDVRKHLSLISLGVQNYATELSSHIASLRKNLEEIELQMNSAVSPAYQFPWEVRGELKHLVEDFQPEEDEAEEVVANTEDQALPALISLLVGLLFGRYKVSADHQVAIDADNIIPTMLEDYFDDDFSSRLPFLLKDIASVDVSEQVNYLTEALGQTVRAFMQKSFYSHHLRTFRGSPIYWVIRSPKGNFQALTYIHRFSIDTLATCRSKYVQPLIDKLRTQQKALQSIDPKKVAALEIEVKDLQELDNRLYDLVLNPPVIDFDEGVVKNHARFATVLQKIK